MFLFIYQHVKSMGNKQTIFFVKLFLQMFVQVFHICGVGGAKHSFLCPEGSVFNQQYLVCDWWYRAPRRVERRACSDTVLSTTSKTFSTVTASHQTRIRTFSKEQRQDHLPERNLKIQTMITILLFKLHNGFSSSCRSK